MLRLLTVTGTVRRFAIDFGTPTSSRARLGSPVMTVRAETVIVMDHDQEQTLVGMLIRVAELGHTQAEYLRQIVEAIARMDVYHGAPESDDVD